MLFLSEDKREVKVVYEEVVRRSGCWNDHQEFAGVCLVIRDGNSHKQTIFLIGPSALAAAFLLKTILKLWQLDLKIVDVLSAKRVRPVAVALLATLTNDEKVFFFFLALVVVPRFMPQSNKLVFVISREIEVHTLHWSQADLLWLTYLIDHKRNC